MKISEDQLNTLGELVDTCENLVAASRLPVNPATHIAGMKGGLQEIGGKLKALYIAISGENPWD